LVQDDAMLSTLVMTVIGPDRPGLVELVTAHVVDHGGNWLESRMCRLGGQFAGIVRIEIPAEKCDALLATLGKLEKDGLQISARKETALPSSARGTVAVLELVGQDRPGILHQISRVLAQHSVNVEELSSDRINAPMDGSMLFQARISVLLPAAVSLAQLRSELEKIATDLMVDVQLNPASTGRK
jgi:glycine cleavage system regulatory protein